jgi:hypothetical protein
MPDTISREMFNSLLPVGPLWIPADSEGFDQLLEGIADNAEEVRAFLSALARLRSPLETPILSDLEKEYGIFQPSGLTDTERRQQLLAAKTANKGDGTSDFLESKLQTAGFAVQVHGNEPPIDPDIILDAGYLAYMASDEAYCGNENAICGKGSGMLIANDIPRIDATLTTPAGSDTWPSIFFVGGDATRNAGTGALESIVAAAVPIARAAELLRLIVKYKPFHTWCGLMITFV